MDEISQPTVTLTTAQVNRLIDIARRWYALARLIDPLASMADVKWETPLAEAQVELLEATSTLLQIVRPGVPGIEPEGLYEVSYIREVSVAFRQDQAEQVAELARRARLRSHRLHPLLTEVPEDSVTFWDARKLVDRLVSHAGELLEYVRLVDPARATAAARASERG